MEKDKIIAKAVEWYDPDTTETVRLACEERGLELLYSTPSGREDEILAVVKGPVGKVEQFAEDVEDGLADPYEAETRDMSDNEYEAWLREKLAAFGVDYEPKRHPDEDEDA